MGRKGVEMASSSHRTKCINLLYLNIVECRALFQKDRSLGDKEDDALRHTMVRANEYTFGM